jgi:hypothetical protein
MGYHFKLTEREYLVLPKHVRDMFPDRNVRVGYLLTESSTKTVKGIEYGYLSQVLYFAPSDLSGMELCNGKSEACAFACLNASGQLGLDNGIRATMARTLLWRFRPLMFWTGISEEIARGAKKALKKGMGHSVRLNGTSDIPFEARKNGKPLKELMRLYQNTRFYDYTKLAGRCLPEYVARHGLKDYHLTFSFSGENWRACEMLLERGVSVAVCFDLKKGEQLPETYQGYKVIDGDVHDLRFLDERGVIVGLRYKLPKRKNARNSEGKGTIQASEVGSFAVSL